MVCQTVNVQLRGQRVNIISVISWKQKRKKSLLSAPLCVCVCVCVPFNFRLDETRNVGTFNALEWVIKPLRSTTLKVSRDTSATYEAARDEIWDLSCYNLSTCYCTRGT